MPKIKRLNSVQAVMMLQGSGLKKAKANKYFTHLAKNLKEDPNLTYKNVGILVQSMNEKEFQNFSTNVKSVPFFKIRSMAIATITARKIAKTTTPEQMKLNQKQWKELYPKFMDFLQNIWKK